MKSNRKELTSDLLSETLTITSTELPEVPSFELKAILIWPLSIALSCSLTIISLLLIPDAEMRTMALPSLISVSSTACKTTGCGVFQFVVVKVRSSDPGLTEISGETPVNPSGGCLGVGNLLECGGAQKVLDTVLQLRGEAGRNQIENVNTGLAMSWRGLPTTTGAVVILSNV